MINKDYLANKRDRVRPVEFHEVPRQNLFFKGVLVTLAIEFIAVVMLWAVVGFFS